MGYGDFPICIAKTQYSFSTDPKIYGAVDNFEFHVQDIVMNAGAEMLVVIAGEIMRMPGLPKEPQALHIDIVNGEIEALSSPRYFYLHWFTSMRLGTKCKWKVRYLLLILQMSIG